MTKKIDQVVSRIFTECLGFENGNSTEPILTVFDNYGMPIAEEFAEYAAANKLNYVSTYWHHDQQINPGIAMQHLHMCIEQSTILINILSSSDDSTSFRIDIVEHALEHNLKILHLPGVTLDILAKGLWGIDYEQLNKSVLDVSEKLSKINQVEIITCDRYGENHHLFLNITDRCGHACGGIAKSGDIMNLPSGEAYIAPIETDSFGSIVINGSGPDCVFHDSDEAILIIEKGYVNHEESTFSESVNSRSLKELLQRCSRNDEDYKLGEFGIGMNTAIKALTGEVILDEKMFGTAHIAFGSNHAFGGALRSTHHHDMIFIPEIIKYR